MDGYRLGALAGLEVIVTRMSILSSLLLWAVLSLVLALVFDAAWLTAVIGGLAAVVLHWFAELWHQLGHAWVARRVGYPMIGIRSHHVLALSQYPADEPKLPAAIHIRRALGGPAASLLLTLLAALVFALVSPAGGVLRLVSLFWLAECLLVFTLGAFLPLGFTDGSTLLEWRGKS